MTELIKITTNENGEQAVSARELYNFLEVRTAFKDWFPRMCEYGFTKQIDFCSKMSKSSGGRPALDYALTLEMSKEICMIQRTEKGKQARQYFINCEKQLKAVKPMTITEIVAANANMLVQQEKAINALKSRQVEQDEQLKQVNQSVNNISNIVATNEQNWRHDCDRILQKCANELDNELSYATRISAIRTEVYTRMKQDYSIDLNTRLKNAQKKMERLGVPKTKIKKLNKVDMIARDKKAIMAYVDVCKQMALKYKIVL
jgi:phage anti-repressor protein